MGLKRVLIIIKMKDKKYFSLPKEDMDYFIENGQAHIEDIDKDIVLFDGWYFQLIKDKYFHVKDPNAIKGEETLLKEEALERQIRNDKS